MKTTRVLFSAFGLQVACATFVAAQSAPLGAADGRDLPALDTGRVRVGDAAPNFALASMAGGTVTLSQFRGKKNVVLVFYRGHW